MPFSRKLFIVALGAVVLTQLFINTAFAQRDNLTEKEQELVREAQEISKRTDVFIKAIERRLLVINNPNAVQTKKEEEKWGALPAGTRAQLLADIARIFDEAITNIDDTAERSPKSEHLPKALKALNDAAQRLMPQLIALRDKTSEDEREQLERAIENAQSIIDAANKKH
jgi:hypothetical protein